MHDNKVLITGGAGFIGSHIGQTLVEKGYQVHILDNLTSGKIENIPKGGIFHNLDIRDEYGVNELFANHKFPLMFHEAAQMSVIKSIENPVLDADVNIRGLVTLLNAMRKNGKGKVVFASSGGVIYGEPVSIPQKESDPLIPISPYGVAKKASEDYLRFFWETYRMPFVSLRYGNVYGPRQNPHSGAGVIGIFMEKILQNEIPVINGSGAKTRDYVYISDVVDANLAAMEYDGVGAFNVGTGIETSVLTLFHHIRDICMIDVPEQHNGDKTGEQNRSVLDIKMAKDQLVWEPKVKFYDGLKNTIAWYIEAAKKENKRLVLDQVPEKV